MRVFSQINNCQQKRNKKKNKNKTQKQKTDKTKRGAPLLGLAKSIYYNITEHLFYSASQCGGCMLLISIFVSFLLKQDVA